jgi:lipoprotein-releasing system permease protein
MGFEGDIARRYVRPRRQSGFIAVISVISAGGVFVGVMATLVVLSIMNGFRTELQARILGTNAHVIVLSGLPQGITDYDALTERLRASPDVLGASPFVYGKGIASGRGGEDGVVLKGVDPERERRVTDILQHLREGAEPLAPASERDLPGIYLGWQLAATLQTHQGDEVTVTLPFEGTPSPLGFVPRVRRFQVAGIFNVGMYEFDASLGLIDLRTAQRLFFPDADVPSEHVTAIQLRIAHPERAREVARRVLDELGPQYWQNNWIDQNRNLFTWMRLEKVAMFLVTALIVVVAAFNIVSTLIMVVMEKRRDIGIMRAMGATTGSVRRVFVTQGLLIGGTGVLAGVVAGWGLSILLDRYRFIHLPDDVYFISTLPVRMEWLDFAVVPGIALVICYLAAIYPAWRASRLDPVQAIRYE